MAKDAADVNSIVQNAKKQSNVNEALFVQEAKDWMQPYLNYLQRWLLPPHCTDAIKIQKKSFRFFVDEGNMFRRGFNQTPLRCLAGEITSVLREVHLGKYGEDQRGSRLAKQIIHLS